jgi:hypothetical protein
MKAPKKRVPRKKGASIGFTIRKFPIDDNNYVLIKSNDRLINIKLHLQGDKPREIGTVTKSTRTIQMKRKRGLHLFRKMNAYGFNDYILRNQTTFDWIRLSDDTGSNWKIPVSYILESGQYMNFKNQGFELQRFVPLEQLEQFRVQTSENRRF